MDDRLLDAHCGVLMSFRCLAWRSYFQLVKSSWDPRLPENCGDGYVFDIIGPLPWALSFLICPLPIVRKLHTSTRHKLALGGTFLVRAL